MPAVTVEGIITFLLWCAGIEAALLGVCGEGISFVLVGVLCIVAAEVTAG